MKRSPQLIDMLRSKSMAKWATLLEVELDEYFGSLKHGDYPKWQQAIDNLPDVIPSNIQLNSNSITIGDANECSAEDIIILKEQLKALMPWRKGPFNIFSTDIDTEWRSDLKWSRLVRHIKPLENRAVLDIGCGNGYYGWRMLGEEAQYVVGLDPSLLFYMQFNAVKKYIPNANIDLIPFGIQKLPDFNLNFDTVFSMGVIYHRRDPVEHLLQLKNCLIAGGELVLETLIVEGNNVNVLIPEKRYAKMNNVWAVPSTSALIKWAQEAGFINARIVDVSTTTIDEQRRTEWMQFESLSDFLDKEDSMKTVEGYPAPVRAIMIADKP